MPAQRYLLLAVIPYLIWLIFAYRYHFLDGVNLALHEAGHLIFGFGSDTLQFLGGTLGQLLFPLAFAVHFYQRRNSLGQWVCVMWLAESLMYAAEYMGDAQAMRLPLVGGGIHDWNWLFRHWGMLEYSGAVSAAVHLSASVLMVIAWFKAFGLDLQAMKSE